jgi:formate hydrogenlyase subunit 6/NADH:ubiquinone oxidoreductase subunit I
VKPEFSYTVSLGMQSGQGTYIASEIELLGDPLESFVASDFNVNRDPISNIRIGQGVFSFEDEAKMPKPYIVEDKCVMCGVCVDMCPIVPKVVDWHDGDKAHAPTYDYSRCIRCFCCQEVCPSGAIFIKEPEIV